MQETDQVKVMQEAIRIVEKLDDVQAVKVLKVVNRYVFKAVPVGSVKKMAAQDTSLNAISNLSADVSKQRFDPEQSVELTEKVLLAFAQDESLAPIVVNAWEEMKDDDSLMVETIITLGLIANLTLFMATTEIEFEIGGVKIKKGKANADLIKAVLTPVTEYVKKIGGVA